MHFLRPTVQGGCSQLAGTTTYSLNQSKRATLTLGTQVPNRHLFRRNTGRCPFVAPPQVCPLHVTCDLTCPLWSAGNTSWSGVVPPTFDEDVWNRHLSLKPSVARNERDQRGWIWIWLIVKRKHKISERLRLSSQQQLTHYSAPFHRLVSSFPLLNKDSTSAQLPPLEA